MAKKFSLVKKPKMEINIRTPYKTFVKDFNGFSRLVTRTTESALVVQNRMPAAVHILPPGVIKLRTENEMKDFSGELVHTGGFLVIHPDNSCDVNLMEAFDKKNLSTDKIGKNEMAKEEDTNVSKFVERIRNTTQKTFLKNA